MGVLIANVLSPALVPEGKHIPLMVNEHCFNWPTGLTRVQLIYVSGGCGAGNTVNMFLLCVV